MNSHVRVSQRPPNRKALVSRAEALRWQTAQPQGPAAFLHFIHLVVPNQLLKTAKVRFYVRCGGCKEKEGTVFHAMNSCQKLKF